MPTDKASPVSTYRVVFWGACTLNHDRQLVAKRFARRFNIRQPRQLQYLFSGRLVTLKSRVSYREACRYGRVIRALGAACRVEKETNWNTAFESVNRESVAAVNAITEKPTLQVTTEACDTAVEESEQSLFGARDVSTSEHPPLRYQDPRAASKALSSRRLKV